MFRSRACVRLPAVGRRRLQQAMPRPRRSAAQNPAAGATLRLRVSQPSPVKRDAIQGSRSRSAARIAASAPAPKRQFTKS